MDINTFYPSKYLSAGDLPGPVRVTIQELTQEMVGMGPDAETKPALRFVGKQKTLILNKTNAAAIAAQHGNDTDGWAGREIVLKPVMVDFKGKMVPGVRVDARPPAASAAAPVAGKPSPHDGPAKATDPLSDEIPW